MPLYMATFGYSPETWSSLIKSPENREETVRRIMDEAGCKLHHLWYAFGDADGFAVIEAPENATAAGVVLAITASGAFRSFKTTVLMTMEETLEALDKAGSITYSAPGARQPAHA